MTNSLTSKCRIGFKIFLKRRQITIVFDILDMTKFLSHDTLFDIMTYISTYFLMSGRILWHQDIF